MEVLRGIAVGLGATLFMDLWAWGLNRGFGVAAPNYCLVGRWVCHMTRGRFAHANINNATAEPQECAVGWISHYVVGAVYSLVLLAIVSPSWFAKPTFPPALLFGLVTVLVPFLIMQPSFGLGVAACRSPDPTKARLKSLMAHTAFGVGLYLCAVGLSDVPPVR